MADHTISPHFDISAGHVSAEAKPSPNRELRVINAMAIAVGGAQNATNPAVLTSVATIYRAVKAMQKAESDDGERR